MRRKKPKTHEQLRRIREHSQRLQKARQEADAEHPPSAFMGNPQELSGKVHKRRELKWWEKVIAYKNLERNGLKRTHD